MTGPIKSEERNVPTESGPPSNPPITNTETSMIVRMRLIDQPVRSDKTRVKPSRGPAPNREAMYMPAPKPAKPIPKTRQTHLIQRKGSGGTTSRKSHASINRPTNIMLSTVPGSGSLRFIHAVTATSKRPTSWTHTPMERGVFRESPMWSTSQGATPKSA